jgi:hypothetical protein
MAAPGNLRGKIKGNPILVSDRTLKLFIKTWSLQVLYRNKKIEKRETMDYRWRQDKIRYI